MGIVLLYSPNRPLPEFKRHHVSHIATETIYSFASPVHKYIKHFVPCIWYRMEMTIAVKVIYPVIELYCVVPVTLPGESGKAIISCSFCRELHIGFFS